MARHDSKRWGKVCHAHHDPEVDLIHVRRGGFSSKHYHANKENLFVLVSGEMDIMVFDCGHGEKHRTIQLREPGDSYIAHAGVTHRFVCLQDAIVTEVYWRCDPPKPSDIEREDTNGVYTEGEIADYLQDREDK